MRLNQHLSIEKELCILSPPFFKETTMTTIIPAHFTPTSAPSSSPFEHFLSVKNQIYIKLDQPSSSLTEIFSLYQQLVAACERVRTEEPSNYDNADFQKKIAAGQIYERRDRQESSCTPFDAPPSITPTDDQITALRQEIQHARTSPKRCTDAWEAYYTPCQNVLGGLFLGNGAALLSTAGFSLEGTLLPEAREKEAELSTIPTDFHSVISLTTPFVILTAGSPFDEATLWEKNSSWDVKKELQAREIHWHCISDVCDSTKESEWIKLIPTFESLFNVIDQGVFGDQKVLVHCQGGISRSAALLIAYLCNRLELSADEAEDFLRSRRPCVNTKFREHLETYATALQQARSNKVEAFLSALNRTAARFKVPDETNTARLEIIQAIGSDLLTEMRDPLLKERITAGWNAFLKEIEPPSSPLHPLQKRVSNETPAHTVFHQIKDQVSKADPQPQDIYTLYASLLNLTPRSQLISQAQALILNYEQKHSASTPSVCPPQIICSQEKLSSMAQAIKTTYLLHKAKLLLPPPSIPGIQTVTPAMEYPVNHVLGNLYVGNAIAGLTASGFDFSRGFNPLHDATWEFLENCPPFSCVISLTTFLPMIHSPWFIPASFLQNNANRNMREAFEAQGVRWWCFSNVEDDGDNPHNWNNLLSAFKAVTEDLDRAVFGEQPTLVHCQAGISRSATLLLLYLIDRLNVSPLEALIFLKSKRPCVNPKFMHKLFEYARQKGAPIA
jgi:protein-tyrosine phosphatase